ncbi:hypothetical protein Tco_0786260 [Tanacetum coccineum]
MDYDVSAYSTGSGETLDGEHRTDANSLKTLRPIAVDCHAPTDFDVTGSRRIRAVVLQGGIPPPRHYSYLGFGASISRNPIRSRRLCFLRIAGFLGLAAVLVMADADQTRGTKGERFTRTVSRVVTGVTGQSGDRQRSDMQGSGKYRAVFMVLGPRPTGKQEVRNPTIYQLGFPAVQAGDCKKTIMVLVSCHADRRQKHQAVSLLLLRIRPPNTSGTYFPEELPGIPPIRDRKDEADMRLCNRTTVEIEQDHHCNVIPFHVSMIYLELLPRAPKHFSKIDLRSGFQQSREVMPFGPPRMHPLYYGPDEPSFSEFLDSCIVFMMIFCVFLLPKGGTRRRISVHFSAEGNITMDSAKGEAITKWPDRAAL